MERNPERRGLIDPRYVYREEFERFAGDVKDRFTRMATESDLYRSHMNRTIAQLEENIANLRAQLARQTAILSLVLGIVGLVGGPLITYALIHH
jgi:Mg2+ and Co2+ transporter CorA